MIRTVSAPKHPLIDPGERVAFRVGEALVARPDTRWLHWNKVMDLLFFLGLVAVGAGLLYLRQQLRWNVFGNILAEAGLTPLLLASWSLLMGSAAHFKHRNVIKACSAAAVFAVGYRLLERDSEGPVDLMEVLAPALLELGVVFFISKMFFLAEDAELQVERLEEQLAEARRSPGVGLALSYFYNFLLPVASAWPVEAVRVEGALTPLVAAPLIVYVPRQLVAEHTLKAELSRLGCSSGQLLLTAQHRPLFLHLLDYSAQRAGPAFDVPTVVHSIFERARAEGTAEADDIVAKELIDFQNELVRLCRVNGLSQHVAVVSIPPPPFDLRTLQEIGAKCIK